jgi:P2 family phage contractile tail tube protein
MAGILINKITNANIYIAGASFLGRAEEITLPSIKAKFSDHKGLGMIMDVEFPNGFEKMTGKVKWSSLYPDVVQEIGSPFNAVQMQIRADMATYDASGAMSESSVVCFLTVRFKDSLSAFTFKMNEPSEQESEFSATYYRLEVNGIPLVEIDAISQLFFLADEDQLAQYRANLGI